MAANKDACCPDIVTELEKNRRDALKPASEPDAMLRAGIIIFITLLLFPIFLGQTPKFWSLKGDPWVGIVKEYQTLFTGILAVGAAWLTIRQMQFSDQKSDERHTQVIELGLRSERLKVERAINPQLRELRLVFVSVQAIKNYLHFKVVNGRPLVQDYFVDLEEISERVSDILARPAIIAAEDLFDGDLSFRILEMRRRTEAAMGPVRHVAAYLSNPFPSQDEQHYFENWFENEGAEHLLLQYILYCNSALPDVLDGLSRLAADYRIDL